MPPAAKKVMLLAGGAGSVLEYKAATAVTLTDVSHIPFRCLAGTSWSRLQ